MSEHTPEPWEISTHLGVTNPHYVGVIAHLGLNTEDNMIAVVTSPGHVVTMAECDANARRIVACVNACAGIPTGDLERPGMLERARLYARPLKDLDEAGRLLRQWLNVGDDNRNRVQTEIFLSHDSARLGRREM